MYVHKEPVLTTVKAGQDEANKALKRLELLIKRPDNLVCADCPIKGPRWASINLGIFVCMPCAGIHRNLGVHISKMKSVNLDKWNIDWVEYMEATGNVRANSFWQANVPPGYQRPTDRDAADQSPVLEVP
jgi:stromal membrane-associated protein